MTTDKDVLDVIHQALGVGIHGPQETALEVSLIHRGLHLERSTLKRLIESQETTDRQRKTFTLVSAQILVAMRTLERSWPSLNAT